MAASALTVQNIVAAGLAASYAAANVDGNLIANPTDRRTFLHVINGGGGSIDVTITAQNTSVNVPGYGDASISDMVVAVAAGAEKFIGPFPASAFNNSSGQVAVSYSGVTTVTVAALRLP